MPASVFMVGETYARLTVTKKDGVVCTCHCQCGNTVQVRMDKLRSGKTRSCGCLRTELRSRRSPVEKALAALWSNMKQRCTNPTHPAYPRYGGRGITMDERWANSSDAFIADMAPTYRKGLTIERIDNDKGYSKDNCVWADWYQQASNRGNTVRFQDGESVAAWARQQGLDVGRAGYLAARLASEGALTQDAMLHNWTVRAAYTRELGGTFPNGATFSGVARVRNVPVERIAEAYNQLLFETGDPPTQAAALNWVKNNLPFTPVTPP